MQRSYIPLTYTPKSDPEVTTKLRICGNSSFKTGKSISLNNSMIPGPQYLNNIEGILLRWRMANQVAQADVNNCYHKIWSAEGISETRWNGIQWWLLEGGLLYCIVFWRCFGRFYFAASNQWLCWEVYGCQHKKMFNRKASTWLTYCWLQTVLKIMWKLWLKKLMVDWKR